MRVAALLLLILLLTLPAHAASGRGTIPPVPGRLLVIGDSLTSGLFASSEQTTFASQVAAATGYQLARKHASRLPQAVAAWTMYRDWRPDLVIVEIGLNDISSGEWAPDTWRSAYSAFIGDIQRSGATVVVATTFWAGVQSSQSNYANYVALNDDIRAVAAERGAILADLWTATEACKDCVSQRTQPSYWPPFLGDNFHPNDAGHAIITKTILAALNERSQRWYFPGIYR